MTAFALMAERQQKMFQGSKSSRRCNVGRGNSLFSHLGGLGSKTLEKSEENTASKRAWV